MNCKIYLAGVLMLICNAAAWSQPKITVEEYIAQYKDLAIDEMRQYRIPASITLAQGILESECGNSPLARSANNHFGIKCHKEWTGKTFFQDDDVENECFRQYQQPEESYRDHSEFLTTRDRYNFLFEYGTKDYKSWAYGLKQAGYATNPRYPELLIKIIEENGLSQFDVVGGQQSAVGGRRSAVSGRRSAVGGKNTEVLSDTPEVFEIFGRLGNDRVIFLNNGVKFILAREGDDFYKIAGEFAIYSRQLFVYNDMDKKNKIYPGQKVYLEKKRRKGEYDSHVTRPGENLHSISQDYGIRLKRLCLLNIEKCGGKLDEGDIVKLK